MALKATRPKTRNAESVQPQQAASRCFVSVPGIISALLLAAGIALAGWFIGAALCKWQAANRYVTVKGLAEREVTSDAAIWLLRFTATGNDLMAVSQKVRADQAAIEQFLAQAGFKAEEINQGQLKVTDLMAREYRSEGANASRYILESSLVLRTAQVEAARQAAQQVGQLVQAGIVLVDNKGPIYRFTGLNDVKPQLIAEATKNARSAAEQFARDSGAAVGGIRNANQGTITISEQDGSAQTEAEFGGLPGESGIVKKLRVVATVDYYLE